MLEHSYMCICSDRLIEPAEVSCIYTSLPYIEFVTLLSCASQRNFERQLSMHTAFACDDWPCDCTDLPRYMGSLFEDKFLYQR